MSKVEGRLKKIGSFANVVEVGIPKGLLSDLSYTELIVTRRWLEREVDRVKETAAAAAKIDEKGVWPETLELEEKIAEMEKGLEHCLMETEIEMIRRTREGR